ncbi:peptidylprolyl isomerase [Roseovarius sp. EL26]|uniref:peptidylprolyl isomerase n=1 Tax=Roseovarius sp. EL26 TaxID=2126672 RepID=UPI000EA23F6A|nr:peptidylprolyl isomerase [Roseovarius sp. EL26]
MLFSRPLRPVYSLLTVGFLTLPAIAQETPDPDQVLAEINGEKITLGHVIAMRTTLPAQYDQVADQILFDGLLNQLVQQTLLMQAGEGEPSKLTQLSIENERRALIANANSRGVLIQDIDDGAIETLYNERYTSAPQETEYNAAHILVETEDEAKAIIATLDDGADFTEQAKEKSIGPSSTSGGELGWFGAGTMVAPFFEGVKTLQAGEHTADPVQTEFGWHVILLKETRDVERPKLEEVRGALEEELRTTAFEDYLAELESKADIIRTDVNGFDPKVINDIDILEN